MKKKYFSLEKNKKMATLNIYGDITSWPWLESDVSAYNLSKQLEEMNDVDEINVYINSYGGEVAEGLAIYNALKRHKAKVRTHCDGFACSIASVIFMAGDERIMNPTSLLMIHNAWTYASGNAQELRKQAEDLDKITQASIEAYKSIASIDEDEIKALMDAETWILPDEAIEYGFATKVLKDEKTEKASQSAWLQIFELVKAHRQEEEPEDPEEPEEPEQPEDPEQPEEPEQPEDPEDESEEEEQNEAAQKWSGFFNALLKM